METMSKIFTVWESTIEQYRDTPHVEIEIRLGKVNRGSFDTNVGQQTFEKVLHRLRKFDGWEKTTETQTTVYTDTETSKRVVMNDVTDEMESAVVKKRLYINDQVLEGFPVDARLCISSEVPYNRDADTEENFTRVKKRKRVSFLRKGLSIDLTEVHGEAEDKDSEDAIQYQVELEITNPPTSIPERKQLFNIIYKISDICAIIL